MFALSAHRKEQPKTFSNQSKLPRLPVPDLEKSLEGYLKSLEPILEQTYEGSALANEVEKRKLFAKDFVAPGGLGRVLQERLKDLDHVSPNNWLNDTLWLGLAYHTWRAPLLVNSNWWLLFAPDSSDPSPPISSSTPPVVPEPNPKQAAKEWITDWQIRKAAWIARRFAEFRTKLLREEILPDSSKAGPFDMHQYSRMFNLSRIPLPNSDAFSAVNNKATHLTLLIDNYIYAIDVFSPSEHGVPEPLPASAIEKRFQAAVADAKSRKDRGENATQVGVLTADERDNWTKNREHLVLLSPENRSTLNSISSSLIALSLDPYTLPSTPSNDPLRLPSVDAQVRNTASGIAGAQNRWFDKAVSIMVETNGRAGIMGEHSPVDALIPSIVGEYVLAEPVDQSQFTSTSKSDSNSEDWKGLNWVLDEQIQKEIEDCKGRNQKLIDDSDASQLWWNEYGAEWIKAIAKQSPDAYIQQALQLAWYKDQGYATATYETASTRMMLHGRTDVIRSLSNESRSFVKSMLDDESDVSESKRYSLLTEACKAHNHLTRRSSAGQGYDRHLMGLKVHLRAGESHPLFDDEMYSKSQEWKLSTSGLSAGGKFMGTGFGAAWPDGYGINYLAGPYLVKFGIESKFSCEKTSTQRFKHNLAQALRNMRRVCESYNDSAQTRAKI
uniref:Carnitine acetyltransferase n=1 Tax=Kwoniella dejecticola CBS 10117 TaxID=1296121 RepID=A0A1A5ZX12_9TREE|nr:carnitine acetyltransferase [Kwoniella dejecticola CBS 10117]OBR82348.1 carnitine acetyltransferase [Kwoniella dejecticola CBS 10117]